MRSALKQRRCLCSLPNELDTLEQLVERAGADNPSLRCAAPLCEYLNQTFPTPALESGYTLLAADGSQINPDRHAMVEFGAINVGAIRMLPGQGQAPEETGAKPDDVPAGPVYRQRQPAHR